jgi:rhodanese-related sulfurtransferase
MTEAMKPEEARQPVASREVFVLDIREDGAWLEESTRIPGSVHIPADELESRIDEVPDDMRILVVSPDGERCAEVAEKLDGEGKEAVSLEGGVEAWRSDGLMTQPSTDADPPKDEGEEPVEEPDDSEDSEDSDDSVESSGSQSSEPEAGADRAEEPKQR